MNYWLTLHYPISKKDSVADWKYWIFLKNRRNIANNDRVFIYETATNPGYIENNRTIKRPPGRKGIVALVRVAGNIMPYDGPPEVLEDGRKMEWKYMAKTKLETECYIPLDELRQALEKQGWSARVNGGLMDLSEDQFNRIRARCV